MSNVPTWTDYHQAKQLVEEYENVRKRMIEEAIADGEVVSVASLQQNPISSEAKSYNERVAYRAVRSFLRTRESLYEFTVKDVQREVPETDPLLVNGKKVSSWIKSHKEYEVIGFSSREQDKGYTLFKRKTQKISSTGENNVR